MNAHRLNRRPGQRPHTGVAAGASIPPERQRAGAALARFTALALIGVASLASALEDYANPQIDPLYVAEAILPDRIAVQYEPIPANETWVRIRHMGDVGTEELEQQAANWIWSDRSPQTGLTLPFLPGFSPGFFQRGYDDVPALGTNVYQVNGRRFGWHLNTYQFGHERPIACPEAFPDCSGGPNIAYGRRFEPGLDAWRTPSSELTLQVYLKLPLVHYAGGERTPAAQVSFLYYLEHVPTGYLIAGLVNLFDTRPFSEVGQERVGSDGVTGFVSSDLRDRQPNGAAYRYVFRSPYSNPSRNRWRDPQERFYRAHISREHLANILADANAPGLPSEYRVIEASIFIEAAPRITGDVSIAGSIRNFELYRFHDDE